MASQADERASSRDREQRLGMVRRTTFEQYREKYAHNFKMERRNGILQVQMHSDGGPVKFSLKLHDDWPQLWMDIGNDPDNEVLIFSGSGDKWIAEFDRSFRDQPISEFASDSLYDHIYWGATKLVEAFIFNIDIPTIACINGSGLHTECALMSDITLCADHAEIFDMHFGDLDVVPGDGLGMTFQELMGVKRAAYYLYTSDRIDAKTAKDIGLVNEVMPLDRLLPRAWEIAEKIMKKPRTTRRLAAAVMRRPWKRRIVHDLGFHLSHELLGLRLDQPI